jgi:Inhibitor of Apoptosis domain
MDTNMASSASTMELRQRRNTEVEKSPIVTKRPIDKRWDSIVYLQREENRLKTFVGWPIRFQDPAKLAQSGFYYLQADDKVQCVFCRGIIGKWEPDDVPNVEHSRFFSYCPFICG